VNKLLITWIFIAHQNKHLNASNEPLLSFM